MEDNQHSDNQLLNEMVMIKNSEEFLKTLNKLVPKSDFIKSDAAPISSERRRSQITQSQNKEVRQQEQNDSDNSNEETSFENETLTKQTSVKTTAKAILTSAVSNPAYPRQARIQKIMRNLDIDFSKQIKETDKKARKKDDLYDEMNRYNKMVNDVKRANRDEELLKMQKKNQEIELQLKELKNKDKSELRVKEEQSRRLIDELNNLFNEKKKEAVEKDDERKKIIEEIKQIKKDQEDHKNTIKKYTEEKENLIKTLAKLDKDIVKLKCYQDFIDKVFESSNQSQNDGFSKLSNKFKELIESMETIQKDIAEQESQIKQIKRQQMELIQKNDKQAQNKRLLELENEIKDYLEKNKKLEREIEEIQKKNQKKDSDTYQIKLSINNLYMKCKYKETEDQKKKQKDNDGSNNAKANLKGNKEKKEFDTNVSDAVLCSKLSEINERIVDLIKIYKELEP
jgi:hypothetical protein